MVEEGFGTTIIPEISVKGGIEAVLLKILNVENFNLRIHPSTPDPMHEATPKNEYLTAKLQQQTITSVYFDAISVNFLAVISINPPGFV